MRWGLVLVLALAGCAGAPVAVPRGPIAVAVAQRGWHTEIGVPEGAVSGGIAGMGPALLHRRYLLIGFGAKKYFTSQDPGAGLAAEALLPGPSVINLSAFDDLGADGSRKIVWIYVSQAEVDGMLGFVWGSLPRYGPEPAPIMVVNNANMFYAARPDYNMLYNCNNWAVDALRAGGLPFSNNGLHFADDVQRQAERIAAGQGD